MFDIASEMRNYTIHIFYRSNKTWPPVIAFQRSRIDTGHAILPIPYTYIYLYISIYPFISIYIDRYATRHVSRIKWCEWDGRLVWPFVDASSWWCTIDTESWTRLDETAAPEIVRRRRAKLAITCFFFFESSMRANASRRSMYILGTAMKTVMALEWTGGRSCDADEDTSSVDRALSLLEAPSESWSRSPSHKLHIYIYIWMKVHTRYPIYIYIHIAHISLKRLLFNTRARGGQDRIIVSMGSYIYNRYIYIYHVDLYRNIVMIIR